MQDLKLNTLLTVYKKYLVQQNTVHTSDRTVQYTVCTRDRASYLTIIFIIKLSIKKLDSGT